MAHHILGDGQLVFIMICMGLMMPFYIGTLITLHHDMYRELDR